jgi:hypothetical protein
MRDFEGHTDKDFDLVARALRAHCPDATPLELDRIKLDAQRRAARRTRSQLSAKGLFMRSRLFITALVAGGVLMLGGGAALGVSGLSSTRSASIAQYNTTATSVVTTQVTQTQTQTQTQAPTQTEETPSRENLGEREHGAPEGAVQGARQVSANKLPFTGYLAIPILLLGLAMLGGGAALRRSARKLDS